MKREEIIKLLEDVGAIRQGHFELSSGRHSGTYIQCALVLQHPRFAEQLGQSLAKLFVDLKPACVVSPALGGVILGHEVGRALDRPDAIPVIQGDHVRNFEVKLDGKPLLQWHATKCLEDQTDEFRTQVRQFIDGLVSHYVLDGGRLVVCHAGLP